LGVVLAVVPEHDLALIEASGGNLPSHEVAEVGEENPAIGEKISVVGQVRGLYWTYVEGTVAQYRTDIPERGKPVSEVNEIGFVGPYLQVSAPVWYGNSGGGAFDMDGKLVGIASFLTGAPHSCYFIHPDVIRGFLKAHKVQ
jgi:S1-C subfamily serine protease